MKRTIRLSESKFVNLLKKIIKENQMILELGNIDMSNITQLRDMIHRIQEEYSKLHSMMEFYKKKGKTKEVETIKKKMDELKSKEDRILDMIDDIWKKG